MNQQQTITRENGFTGIALHRGGEVNVRVKPAPADSGIVFCRTDMDGRSCKADCRTVADAHLATTLRRDDVEVCMVEHLLATLAALGVDNLIVELDAPELPVLDGSAAPWYWFLLACGVRQQPAPRRYIRVKKEVRAAHNGSSASFKPVDDDACYYQVHIDYPFPAVKNSGQEYQYTLGRESFLEEISRARTFCHVGEVEWMQENRRALGGSLQNAVVFNNDEVINAEGLRYRNEFVRHKVLDVVGDCYINGHLILAAYCGERPGHDINHRLVTALMDDGDAWEWQEGDRR